MHIKNAIKFYAWAILAYSIWFLSILPTGISCFSRENDDIRQTNKIVFNVFIGSIKEVNVEQGSLLSRVTEDCVPDFVAP